MTDEKDDWLDDLGNGEEAGGFSGIDQGTIDQLLGSTGGDGGKQAAPSEHVEIEAKKALTENGSPAGGGVEIDQASLDALLNGTEAPSDDFFAPAPAAPAGGESGPLDQSSIDALFGSDDADFQAALEDNSNVPSQADIDELFAQAQEEGDPPAPAPAQGPPPSQDPAPVVEAAPPPATDGVDLNDVPGEGPAVSAPAPGEADFGLDGELAMDAPAASGKTAAPTLSSQEEASLDEDIFGDTLLEPTAPAGKPWRRVLPVHFLTGVSRRSLGGLLAAVLLIGGSSWYLLRGRPPGPPPHPLAKIAKPPAPKPPRPPANTPPEAVGGEVKMDAGRGEVALLLPAKDKEGDTLTYEITAPPQHGRLSGELPTPVYLPNNDFPGQDRIEYRVSDGKAYSKPASVLITGPDLRQVAKAEKPGGKAAAKPRPPLLQARDITLRIPGSRELVIDWRNIWRQANRRPFAPGVRVEIVGKDLHGELAQLDPRRSHYRPDPLFRGSDRIRYRFRKGGASSKVAELRLLVEPGPPPRIRFRERPAESYLVGETVILDVSPTAENQSGALTFTWQQVGGTPVQMKRLNADGSVVSFVVPSSFSNQENAGPVLRVTATDSFGQQTGEVVKIAARSRRQSPLWQGTGLRAGLVGSDARPATSALQPGFVTQ
ncbi:MAG: Ig-like domain-containing protein [Desulfobacteraceae bacterium]|nr:Ig-like domain-containing protein [Desulfobacteraceae bacterium]